MTDINIPPEAVEAAAKAMYMAEPWATFWSIEDARTLCAAAIRAALENWPGMEKLCGEDVGLVSIILRLTEPRDDSHD